MQVPAASLPDYLNGAQLVRQKLATERLRPPQNLHVEVLTPKVALFGVRN